VWQDDEGSGDDELLGEEKMAMVAEVGKEVGGGLSAKAETLPKADHGAELFTLKTCIIFTILFNTILSSYC
jgi:predicted NAD/FAD-dependent oxidoreductase